MNSSILQQTTLAYLNDHQVMTLATHGPEGPWAAAVFYVNQGFVFYFLSAGHTRHAQNIARSGQASGAIHEDYDDWRAIKGVQLEGAVDKLSGADRAQAISLYEQKFSFIKKAAPVLKAGLARVNWYRLTVRTLYFIDNSKGFGHRDRINLDAS